jgi:hypothetical protein
MANVPDHNSPSIKESEIRVFEQNYYIVDEDGECSGQRTDYELHKERIEVLADDNGVFIESKENGCAEVLSIATPEMAMRVAKYILKVYEKSSVDSPSAPTKPDEDLVFTAKFLTPEFQARVAHELWRLENHCTSPHGPVDASGAMEMLSHIKAISNYLDLKPTPYLGAK